MFERLKVSLFLKEFPMVKGVFAWLTDPAAPGRKRGLAAAILIVAETLRATDSIIGKACALGLLVGKVCVLHLATFAPWFDVAYQAVQTYLVPGAEVVGSLVGIWGLIHGAMRQHVVTPLR